MFAQAGTSSIVAGFGFKTGNTSDPNYGSGSNQLQAVSIPIVSLSVCSSALSNSGLNLNFSYVCAGSDGKDACKGDSGSPLAISVSGTFLQIGIVLFGTVNDTNPIQCGGINQYDVYLDVSFYLDFIQSITGILPNLNNFTTLPTTMIPTNTPEPDSSSSLLYFQLPFILLLISFATFIL